MKNVLVVLSLLGLVGCTQLPTDELLAKKEGEWNLMVSAYTNITYPDTAIDSHQESEGSIIFKDDNTGKITLGSDVKNFNWTYSTLPDSAQEPNEEYLVLTKEGEPSITYTKLGADKKTWSNWSNVTTTSKGDTTTTLITFLYLKK